MVAQVKVESLALDDLAALADRLADLRHDLGKYIRFETRFVEDNADLGALRDALRADLLATRRRGDQLEPAVAVWARMRPVELDGDPDVVAIDAAMARLSSFDPSAPEPALREAATLAREVSEATRRLHTRARARLGEG